jgi:hypothetical protein
LRSGRKGKGRWHVDRRPRAGRESKVGREATSGGASEHRQCRQTAGLWEESTKKQVNEWLEPGLHSCEMGGQYAQKGRGTPGTRIRTGVCSPGQFSDSAKVKGWHFPVSVPTLAQKLTTLAFANGYGFCGTGTDLKLAIHDAGDDSFAESQATSAFPHRRPHGRPKQHGPRSMNSPPAPAMTAAADSFATSWVELMPAGQDAPCPS